MKLPVFLLLFSGLFLCSADDYDDVQNLRTEIEKRTKVLASKMEQNAYLEKRIHTLKTTAQVTIDPSTRPQLRGKQSRRLFSDSLTELKGWYSLPAGNQAEIRQDSGRNVIVCSSSSAESVTRSIELPKNSTVLLKLQIRAENVKPKRKNGGTRLGMMIRMQDGQTLWPAAPALSGTFGWTEVSLQAEIPASAKKTDVLLGLAGATGTVYIRNLTIEQIK